MAVTMKDVAARAGVSLKTVSRVINQEASVQKTTREKVLRVVDELGYLPDLSARSLRSARAYAIGLVYDNPNPYYVIGLQEGTLAACREMGYGLQIYPCDSRVPRLTQELINQSQRTRLAGVVLAPPMSENLARIRKLSEAGVNLVRILSASEDPDDGWPCVYVDDRHAAYNITEHLIQLGHTRIGFLWGEKEFGSSVERYKGYVDALAD